MSNLPLKSSTKTNRDKAKTVYLVASKNVSKYIDKNIATLKGLAAAHDFNAAAGEIVIGERAILLGVGNESDLLITGQAARSLPAGIYKFADLDHLEKIDTHMATLGWIMGAYYFDQYKGQPKQACLILPDDVQKHDMESLGKAVYMARDLINTPADDLGPDKLAEAAKALGTKYKAKTKVIIGDQLLKHNFPMVHAVGRAAAIPPRLIDMKWGDEDHPKVTLIGKGVTFDSGGLDIKDAAGMALMKKDMGGAANALALGSLIMAAALKVRLRIIIPAVENAISGNAFRPGDILSSRKGLTVEIGNTDAEGRLILGDALTLAGEESPEKIISLATLTGAARVALGPDLAPLYTEDETFASDIIEAGERVADPIWRMPFYQPYNRYMKSDIADINHISSNGFAGSITAANFLKRFVPDGANYTHFDIYGWVPDARPARPKGGEALAVRAVFEALKKQYG